MPGVQRRQLTSAERQRLERSVEKIVRAEDALFDARIAWADLVETLGQAACAREMSLTPAAMWARLDAVRSGRLSAWRR